MWVFLLILAVIGIAYWLIGRQRERELERRLEQAAGDKDLAMTLIDQEIRSSRARAEFWKKQHGRYQPPPDRG